MFRTVLLAVSAVIVVAAAVCLLVGLVLPGVFVAAIWAVIVGIALLIERYRYKAPLTLAPGPPWQDTGEKFVDPNSGAALSVWFNPGTGQRVYVNESGSGAR